MVPRPLAFLGRAGRCGVCAGGEMSDRYTPKDRERYAKWIDSGHVLELDEDGGVKYYDGSDFHGGPECVECGDMWCEHCPNIIKECEGSGPRLAREAEYKAEREHTAAALKAFDDPKALRRRLKELEK